MRVEEECLSVSTEHFGCEDVIFKEQERRATERTFFSQTRIQSQVFFFFFPSYSFETLGILEKKNKSRKRRIVSKVGAAQKGHKNKAGGRE